MAGFLGRRRWLIVGIWLALLVAALPLAAKQTEELTGGGFDVPGSESAAVEEAVATDFPGADRGRLALAVEPASALTPEQARTVVDQLSSEVAASGEAALPQKAADAAAAQLAAGEVAVAPIDAEGDADELVDVAATLREDIPLGSERDGATPYLVGQPAMWAALSEISKEDLEKAEVIGFPIVALILIAVFGSLAAAFLPLALGVVAVMLTGAVIYLLSRQMEMSVFVTNMASMIGIGVAVDYSLFILARFRESVRAGNSAGEARAEALATSGLAVAFSGIAVIISLAGLWMIDNQALRSMALGAMVVVAIAILVATTLLPALIRLLGHRVEAGGVAWSITGWIRNLWRRRRRPGSTTPGRVTFWERWTAAVMRRPVVSILGASAILLTLTIPVLDLQTGTGALKQFPPDHDARVGTELAAEATGGATDPVRVLATFEQGGLEDGSNAAGVADFARLAAQDPEVTGVARAVPSGDRALIDVQTAQPAESQASMDLVERMRDEIVPASALADVATVEVGGEGARVHDSRVQIDSSMWKIIAFVLAFSFLVLMVMLRSVLLPLKAILMNLLSIGAAYGVLVAVFQWGWLDGFLGFEKLGALDTLTPPLVLAVVFGLSMDYEVFLLSRIKERYEAHGDNRRAVAEGLSSSASVITSAAVIMVAVFSVFVLTGVPSIKQLGLGNAVAIAIDASLVRLILVPAAMQLMGRWNWWLPGWLDRILPHIGLEGPVPSGHGTVQLPAQGRAGDSRAGHAGVRGGGGGNGDPGLPERVDGSDRVGEYVGS
jgi:RND superfamily putative drug exporter